MQFHSHRLGRWKWKRDNIPICLITEKLLQRDVCYSHSHRRQSICTRTLSSTFHILLAQTQNISTCTTNFKAGMVREHPKAIKSLNC